MCMLCFQATKPTIWHRCHIEFRQTRIANAQWKIHSFAYLDSVCISYATDFFFVSAVTHIHCLHFSIKRISLRYVNARRWRKKNDPAPCRSKNFVGNCRINGCKAAQGWVLMEIEINARNPIQITKDWDFVWCWLANCMNANTLQSNLLVKLARIWWKNRFKLSPQNMYMSMFTFYSKSPPRRQIPNAHSLKAKHKFKSELRVCNPNFPYLNLN